MIGNGIIRFLNMYKKVGKNTMYHENIDQIIFIVDGDAEVMIEVVL